MIGTLYLCGQHFELWAFQLGIIMDSLNNIKWRGEKFTWLWYHKDHWTFNLNCFTLIMNTYIIYAILPITRGSTNYDGKINWSFLNKSKTNLANKKTMARQTSAVLVQFRDYIFSPFLLFLNLTLSTFLIFWEHF